MADTFINCKKYLKDDYNAFIVVNDKHNIYPIIFEIAGMKIVNKWKNKQRIKEI